jgi:short-subunit dehydrogenase involved in D-alanine esterification of teichoic acids
VFNAGGSRGSGRALTLRFSAEGARVALVARHQAELHETVKDIGRSGGVAYGIVADVGNKEVVGSMILRQTGVIVNISSSGNSFQFSVFSFQLEAVVSIGD